MDYARGSPDISYGIPRFEKFLSIVIGDITMTVWEFHQMSEKLCSIVMKVSVNSVSITMIIRAEGERGGCWFRSTRGKTFWTDVARPLIIGTEGFLPFIVTRTVICPTFRETGG